MTMQMLTKGTAKHTEEQLADELETYAIGLAGSGQMDSSTVYANCVTDQLERAMTLMAEVILTPTVPRWMSSANCESRCLPRWRFRRRSRTIRPRKNTEKCCMANFPMHALRPAR